MSKENVELVLWLMPASDVDYAGVIRNDELAEAGIKALAPLFHPDFEWVMHMWQDATQTYSGLDGMRAGLADWYAPWRTYRSEVQDAIDCGDRVLLLMRDHGRLPETEQEVTFAPGMIWTLRDGKIARLETFPDQPEALKAVGLEQ